MTQTFTDPEAEVAHAATAVIGFGELSAVEVLADAQDALARRRAAEVSELLACAAWADLHGGDPRDEPCYRAVPGGEVLVQLGGEGTPQVRDLALAEMGIALGRHPLGVRAMTADVLDLRHRLPRTFARVMDGDAEVWVARRVATLSRPVPRSQVGKVDAAVADAIGGVQTSRVLAIAEAAVIAADPEGHRARTAEARSKRYVGLGRPEGTGLRMLVARLASGDAVYVDAMVDRVADILTAQRAAAGLPELSKDRLRADAMGWLARPAELMALLVTHAHDPDVEEASPFPPDDTWIERERRRPTLPARPRTPGEPVPGEPDMDTEVPVDVPDAAPVEADPVEPTDDENEAPEPDTTVASPLALRADVLAALTPQVLAQLRPAATLYVHVHESALDPVVDQHGQITHHGVARVEGHGPLDVAYLKDLLGVRPVTVRPVIDTREHHAVDAYEHPAWMREHITLRAPADQFPNATRVSRHLDLDHPVPWDSGGPPGQTSTESQPLSRTGHRAKTHLPYTATPTESGMVWRTPHGLHRLVDTSGRTHTLTTHDADVLTHGHTALDAALDRIRDELVDRRRSD